VETSITHVAMDVHKKQHEVAWINADTGEVQTFTVRNTPAELAKMVKRIHQRVSGEIHICYEAGVCGFVLQRRLEKLGCVCKVIAPSLVLRKPGERIKTDRRDAKKLLSQFMAGQLTPVCPPDAEQEADRELTRCRYSAQEDLKRTRQQLNSLLIRHGYIYQDGDLWTGKHEDWLGSLEFDQPTLRKVFDEYWSHILHCRTRVASLDRQLQELAESDRYRAAVSALRCFRGINTLTAITVVTEIFDFGRFENPRALMSYLGVVPGQDSSGETHRMEGITKTGNWRVRRILTETGWHCRHAHKVSKALRSRRKDQPAWAIQIADRAAVRLHKRYWHLMERGKAAATAVMAIVRELAGFIWAMLRELHARSSQAV
jgi:transposase